MAMIVVMAMLMRVTVFLMVITPVVVMIAPFFRRQLYFRPLGIAAASANSAHSSSIIGRYRLSCFVQNKSKRLYIQLFTSDDVFKITIAVWAGIKMML